MRFSFVALLSLVVAGAHAVALPENINGDVWFIREKRAVGM